MGVRQRDWGRDCERKRQREIGRGGREILRKGGSERLKKTDRQRERETAVYSAINDIQILFMLDINEKNV